LVTASIAGSIVAIMTVFVIILSCGSCRDSSSCSRAMSRFALAYILLDVLALIANIVSMAMWIQMKEKSEYAPSFWVGWTANGLLLILLVILIILRKCGDEDEGFGDHKSQVSADQPLFRSLYQVTPTTVFHNRS
uniref:G_PROTEIN_RECEP_F1_2 domain-containing protein n=1 Tax=Hydatigena taeniaeformis TaxID=6205 RepID=A0A0R3WY30_HYDTA